MATTGLLTIEDLEALPDDGHVYELIDGELRRRPDVGGEHGAIGGEALRLIGNYVAEHRLGRVFISDTIYSFRRDPDLGLKPDVSFVRTDRLPTGERFRRPLDVVPDLVVEVVSPNDRAGDIEEKIEKYRRFGVPLIWFLWPLRRAVTVYAAGQVTRELDADDQLEGGEILPGFRVAVADLFRFDW